MTRVFAWGANEFGQLGIGTFGMAKAAPVRVRELDNAVAVAARGDHSLALMADGTVRAWGRNDYGQLGDGTNIDRDRPVVVRDISNAVAIAAGEQHSLALLADGTVRAWGRNLEGQLGDGTFTSRNLPVRVLEITGATAIAAGANHSLSLLLVGEVQAWGSNQDGQLGNEVEEDQNTPIPVADLGGTATRISAGRVHSLALLSDGTGRAWGGNSAGQLGDGSNDNSVVTVTIFGLTDGREIVGGGDFSLARRADGSLLAWGRNIEGELGNGENTNRNVPVPVSGIDRAIAIAAGEFHSIALLSDRSVRTWGDNGSGQLGIGTFGGFSNIPVVVEGFSNFFAIAGGRAHSLAIQFTCPSDIRVFNDSGRRGAVVNFSPPVVGPNDTVVCTPSSGSFFPAGVTTVTCTIVDTEGNTSTCAFNVTVVIDPCRYFSSRCRRG